MSITVSDLLTLPSLREAKVLGGRGGLTRIVSSISVLESADPGLLIDPHFPVGEFFGSEIVLTGFINALNNVECQYANMKRLAEGGEVGLILFYVGVYLPKVDESLIRLADELDFVLICMPEGRKDLRYSEVLSDVTGLIFRDQLSGDSIVSEILERASRLPQHLRSVNTVLKMVSDRISASVILSDDSFRMLNLVAWPRSIEANIKESLGKWKKTTQPLRIASAIKKQSEISCIPCPFVGGGQMYTAVIRPDFQQPMLLMLVKEGLPLEGELLKQAVDVVRLSVSIWGEQHGEVAIHELVHSILQDEPMKMRRLADIFHIDVASIHEMWILCGTLPTTSKLLARCMEQLKGILDEYSKVVIADLYEGELLLFFETPGSLSDSDRLADTLLNTVVSEDSTLTLTRCGGLRNTSDVRKAYLCHREHLQDTGSIFPGRNDYAMGEVSFAQECRDLIDEGEEAITRCLEPLSSLQGEHDEFADLRKTLCVYMLDSGFSVARCAELLFVHKNTIKYRLHRISAILGYRPDKMPERIKLYQAVAVARLLP